MVIKIVWMNSNYFRCLRALFLVLIFTYSSYGQVSPAKTDFWPNVRYGGGVGLGFGSNSFNFSLAPSAIYDTRKGIALGLGLSFNYGKFGDTKLTAYGGSLLSYFNPLDFLQLSAEFEQLRINRRLDFGGTTIKEQNWVPALFFGVGYGNRNFVVGIRYDVLYDEGRSLYADPLTPFIRVFF